MSRLNLWVGTNIADRYCITGEIGGGGMGRVYSAIPFADPSQTVAIKVIEHHLLDYEDVLRFQREAALMSRLRHPNIITFHELGLYHQTGVEGSDVITGYYIVMEIAKGHNLKDILTESGRKSLDFFFDLGLQVSSALEYTHAKNIIHRDIKPQNVIIERAVEGRAGILVKVLDFGIARLTELDLYSDDDSLLDIAGTPLYMAPENSKYLEAPIDHRADLYSLGCMLYEVLAGRPPFLGNTREKLARDHAQASPEPLSSIRPDVPQLINDIVMKLIAKHPQDRYQTAFGLHVDLVRVRKALGGTNQRLARFQLARYDRLKILPSNIDMMGREAEFEALVASYQAIAKESGRSRLTVIHGEPGVGKTRFLKEFRAYLAKHRIRYISTSFSRHENNLPFNALANGFNEYLVHVYKTQPLEAEEIKRKVRTLLGPTASLVAQIVQGLKPYLEEEIEEDQVRSGLEQDREFDFNDFAKAFSDFTRCLASEAEPVVFFFDDMQWADDKSIELIDRFFSYNNSQRFLLVISHRPLEPGEGQNFQNFLNKFSKLRRRYHELEIATLRREAVAQLSQFILGVDLPLNPSFVDYLYAKTNGNILYLLELHRSLVTQELINLDEAGRWRFHMDEIYKAHILSNSIDLTLNRLFELPLHERKALEMAAILGAEFDLDMLENLLSDDRQELEGAIKSAVASGLLTRLGAVEAQGQHKRVYAFTHRSIREALIDGIPLARRCQLHRLVALRFEESSSSQAAQLIFTLAHHFFQSLDYGDQTTLDLAEKAIVYNMKAGTQALEVDAPLSAQRYFQNARSLFPILRIPEKQQLHLQKMVYHALADISVLQRDYAEAYAFYKQLREIPLNKREFAFVSYKLLVLGLVSGHVAASLREVVQTFKRLEYPVIRLGVWSDIKAKLRMLQHALWPFENSLPVRVLNTAESVSVKQGQHSFHPLMLYMMGQYAGLNYDKRLGIIYHTELLERCRRETIPEDMALRLLCDHALILGSMGFQKRAYMVLEKVQKHILATNGWQTILAYAIFVQTLIIDQYQGKQEDLHESLDYIQSDLKTQDFQLASMQQRTFRIFLLLVQLQGKDMAKLIQHLPASLTARHWLTSRSVAMYLFWLLLSDSRDMIISYQSFLATRKASNNRRADIFVRMSEAIVSLVAGEKEKARAAYSETLLQFRDLPKDPLLMPHEFDFVLLFIGFFAEVLAFEYGDDILREEMFRPSLEAILKLSLGLKHRRRSIPVLLTARLREILGHKGIKLTYDVALKRAKINQQPLIEMLSELWFGRFLKGEGALMRIDYLSKAGERARQQELHLIEAMSRKIARDLGQITAEDMTGKNVVGQLKSFDRIDQLLVQHMQLLPELRSERMDLQAAQNEVVTLLRHRLDFDQVYLVTLNDIIAFEALGLPPQDKLQQLIAYVSPYINLRSSLSIPIGDAPWMQGQATVAPLPPRPRLQFSDGQIELDLEVEDNVEDTMVMARVEKAPGRSSGSGSEAHEIDRLTQRSMNTLVPLRYAGKGLGILFLERSRLQDEDSTELRQVLDTFGAQIGLWLRAYLPADPDSSHLPLLLYSPGSYHVEPCSWLHVWTEGHLRGGRESVWYLGINLNESSYLLAYCRMNGPEELRAPLASALWHELMALRTLFSGAGREQMNPEDLQEAMEKHLQGNPDLLHLDSVALSFSILQKQKGEVLSGHFGAARPMVIGSINEVTPLNRVVLQLSNGRYLRYWKVHASQLQRSVFIMPHDSSKLDRLSVDSLREQSFESLDWEQKRLAFRKYLKDSLIEGQIPRYFVAAAWKPQVSIAASGLEKAG